MAFDRQIRSDPYAVIRALSPATQADELRNVLMVCVSTDDRDGIEAALSTGLSIDSADPTTGLSALHLAVGRDNLEIARYLVGKGASFMPDKQGRWPTTIAAECRVSKAMCDFIVEAEAAAEGV